MTKVSYAQRRRLRRVKCLKCLKFKGFCYLSKGSRPRGPGFGYPQRGFALLKVLCLIEISNNKSQKTNGSTRSPPWAKSKGKYQHAAQAPALRVTEIQNPKQKTIALNQFGIWYLWFICNLLARRLSGGVLGICDFRYKTPRQNQISLTWPIGPGFRY